MECPKLLRLLFLSMCIANLYVYGEEKIEILEITDVYMTTTESSPTSTISSSTASLSITTNGTSNTPSPSTPTDDTVRTTLPPATTGSTLHPFSPSNPISSKPSPPTPTADTSNTTPPPTLTADTSNTTLPPTPTAETSNTTPTSTPTADTSSTTSPSTPTDDTSNTTSPLTPTDDTSNITSPSSPTADTSNTTSPPTPTAETSNTTPPSAPTVDTSNTTSPSTPTDDTSNTTSPLTPSDDTSNITSPSTPTGDTSNTTSPTTPVDDISNTTSPSSNVTGSSTEVPSSTPLPDFSTSGNEASSEEPQSTTREPTPPGPIYPEKTYPNIIGESVLKKIQAEVALLVDENGCDPESDSESDACKELEDAFINFAEEKYGEILGFESIVVSKLRKGSVIIQHNVSYVYNEMSVEGRQLSAEEIYDRTIALSVNEGESIGEDLSFTTCNDCKAPEELTDLCSEDYAVECDGVMESDCRDNVWTCQSPCDRTEDLYCSNKKAVCSQSSPEEEPSCLCRKSEEGWYFGEDCEMYVDRLVLILSVSIGGGLILLLIVILSICLCLAKKELKESKQLPFERQNAAFLSGKRDLEMAETRQSAYDNLAYDDLPIDDGWLTTTDAAKKTTNAELEKAVKESAEHRNSKYFWGNVADDLITETPSPDTNPDQHKNGDPKVTHGSAANGNVKSNGPEVSDPYNQRYSKVEKSKNKANRAYRVIDGSLH